MVRARYRGGGAGAAAYRSGPWCRLEGAGTKVLICTLRRLDERGFVRTACPAVPLYVEYALTEPGRSVALPQGQLRDWVDTHLPEISSVPGA
ncbi:winged helix-turn-helix transcriptional regulator [Streptomyces goshikiensis]|uniref:winged helix-turn-helix transcriptional regulator n=1 Tax=Streptomyces goshikiensis TaxID=1942 RepID=UPI0036CE34A6